MSRKIFGRWYIVDRETVERVERIEEKLDELKEGLLASFPELKKAVDGLSRETDVLKRAMDDQSRPSTP